jgi:hypothetical protein
MFLKNVATDIFLIIDSSEKTNIFLAVFQGLAATFIGIYNFYPDAQNRTLYFVGFLFFQILVLLFFIGMSVISWKYRAIKLWLNRDNGVLTDLTTMFRNVSLRSETLNAILGSMDTEKAYETGKKVGTDFLGCHEEVLRRKESNYSRLENDDKLKKWLDYDSSSGIAKFEIHSDTGLALKLKITSPFWGECPKKPNPQCKFLMGYVDGFCSALYKKELKSKCELNPSPSFCVLTLEPIIKEAAKEIPIPPVSNDI